MNDSSSPIADVSGTALLVSKPTKFGIILSLLSLESLFWFLFFFKFFFSLFWFLFSVPTTIFLVQSSFHPNYYTRFLINLPQLVCFHVWGAMLLRLMAHLFNKILLCFQNMKFLLHRLASSLSWQKGVFSHCCLHALFLIPGMLFLLFLVYLIPFIIQNLVQVQFLPWSFPPWL